MFRPADVIIDAFVQRLIDDYRQAFFDGSRLNSRTITEVARMALARIFSEEHRQELGRG